MTFLNTIHFKKNFVKNEKKCYIQFKSSRTYDSSPISNYYNRKWKIFALPIVFSVM